MPDGFRVHPGHPWDSQIIYSTEAIDCHDPEEGLNLVTGLNIFSSGWGRSIPPLTRTLVECAVHFTAFFETNSNGLDTGDGKAVIGRPLAYRAYSTGAACWLSAQRSCGIETNSHVSIRAVFARLDRRSSSWMSRMLFCS